ncbi:hypothetical protein MTR67_002100, partial [Solanum verrucosum]
VHKLRTKDVASVKVLWRNQFVKEATWEAEEDMNKRYPLLFTSKEISDKGKTNVVVDALSRDLEFEVDYWVYLKVSPMKGVMRFGKKGKLSPHYVDRYRISKSIGNVAYDLELLPELVAVHPVFHISMLKKCMRDPSLIIPTENIDIKYSLSYEEIPIEILDRQVRKLRTNEVASVKYLWRNQFVEEAT